MCTWCAIAIVISSLNRLTSPGPNRRGSRHRSEGREGTSRHRSPMPSPPSPGMLWRWWWRWCWQWWWWGSYSYHSMSVCQHVFPYLRVVLCSGKRYIGKELGVSEPGKAPPQDASDRWKYSQIIIIHRQDLHRQDIFTDKTPVTGGYQNRQECLFIFSCQWQVDLFTDKSAWWIYSQTRVLFMDILTEMSAFPGFSSVVLASL